MLAKQIAFQEGKIELVGQRVVFSPADFFGVYIERINDDPKLVNNFYKAAKRAVQEGFGINVGKLYGFSLKDYSNWFVELATLSGWGKVYWKDIDRENNRGIIELENSPVAAYLKGKVKSPCDHVIRGFMAGGASSALKLDLDMIETECEALGAQKCKFVMDSTNNLKAKYPNIAKQQLGK